MLFQHTNHLLLLHNVRQTLHYIVEKCLKACMCCDIPTTQYHSIFSEEFKSSILLFDKDIQDAQKKSKSKGIANLLPKVFLVAFSLVVTVIDVPSAFFAPTRAFKTSIDRITLLKQRSL